MQVAAACFARVAWRAGRSADTAAPMPNFGPEREIPATGTADGLVVPVAFGRPGTYALTVEVPGYRTWRTRASTSTGRARLRAGVVRIAPRAAPR